jgi:hypothetical protein
VKATVTWSDPVRDLFLELPPKEQREILEKLESLAHFPRMYSVRLRWRRFRRHRWFRAGNWLVFYRVTGNTVYIRGLWPARIP